MTENDLEALGQIVDRLDAVTYSVKLPVPAEMHVKGLLGTIESVRDELKELVITRIKEAGGSNPWEDD